MIVSGNSPILVNGRLSRVNGRTFNRAIKRGHTSFTCGLTHKPITPSKGLSWRDVSHMVRQGKKIQAKVG